MEQYFLPAAAFLVFFFFFWYVMCFILTNMNSNNSIYHTRVKIKYFYAGFDSETPIFGKLALL